MATLLHAPSAVQPDSPAARKRRPRPTPRPRPNPRDSWPAWTDADRWAAGSDDAGPAPSWDAESFEPDPLSAAYQLGYELGLAGEFPKAPAHFSERERLHFGCGRLAGFIASEDGRAWYEDMEAHRDRAFAEYDAYRDSEPGDSDAWPAGCMS